VTEELTADPHGTSTGAGRAGPQDATPGSGGGGAGLVAFTAALVALLLGQFLGPSWFAGFFDHPAVQTWATVFVSITVQALPFLVFGVVLSAAITVLVPANVFRRTLPQRPVLAVPVAGAAGVVLPGCECASVPVAGGLVSRGVTPAAALAFLLSAPAVNPVVMVSTAVAFPGRPEVVAARFVASLATAMVMGWLWLRFARPEWLRLPRRPHLEGRGRLAAFRLAMQHDVLHAGGFLVVGGLTAATLNVVVPRDLIGAVAGDPVWSVLFLAGLAVVLAICSEADAFVAASLSEFSLTARLAFLVVGPAVDVKLVALQSGTFGRDFAARFAPATFVVAVVSSVLVGWWWL
jgi:uncharacterized membrane protein YraQ (UPF0718 family)